MRNGNAVGLYGKFTPKFLISIVYPINLVFLVLPPLPLPSSKNSSRATEDYTVGYV